MLDILERMTITLEVHDSLRKKAASRGLSVEAYVQALVAADSTNPKPGRTPSEAVAHLRRTRQGVTLGGLTIKDLINEGRQY